MLAEVIICNFYTVEERFVREVAKTLTTLHKHKLDKVGFLDEHLNVK